MEIETIAQLAATFPDLFKEIQDKSFQEGVDSVDTFEAIETAEQNERDRVLGLVSAKFGDEEGDKFKALVETGVTVDQFKAIADANPAQPEGDKKDEILEAITEAGADNPGSDHNADLGTGGKGFLQMVNEYMGANGCKRVEAMQAIIKSHPDKHAEYIKSVN
jgi:hypothetical protein